jgi:hypothetical protein
VWVHPDKKAGAVKSGKTLKAPLGYTRLVRSPFVCHCWEQLVDEAAGEHELIRERSMVQSVHPAAAHHLPPFITAPGDTDVLLVLMAVILIVSVMGIGVFFFWLHSLPERMVHNRVQFDIVAILCLLSLFTHVHAFWVAALLLALIRFPDLSVVDFLSPLRSTAGSLEKMAGTGTDPLVSIAGSLEKMAHTDAEMAASSLHNGSVPGKKRLRDA